MADDWVADSLVGFLQSPVWKFQVDTFLEQECIVFDEGGENEPVYKHVYSGYKNMVDKLMNTFMSELGVSEQQLTEACAKSKSLRAEQEKMFQPLLASGNYELFKSIMVQKNIDLELQALALLEKQLGQSIDAYESQANASPTPQQKLAKQDAEEEEALQDALKLSKRESELKLVAEDREMEKLLELAIQESLNLHRESLKMDQQRASQQDAQGEQAGVNPAQGIREISSGKQDVHGTETVKDDSSTGLDSIPPLSLASGTAMQQEISGEQAAQLWIQSAKSELENRQSPVVKQRKSKWLPEELKAREKYLKNQRDRLLESKRKARAQELKHYKETALGSHPAQSPTPSSPRALTEDVKKAEVDPGEVRRDSTTQEEHDGTKLTPKRSSGVLCSVIARKLRLEQML